MHVATSAWARSREKRGEGGGGYEPQRSKKEVSG